MSGTWGDITVQKIMCCHYMPFIYLFFVFKLVLAIDKNYCCSQHTLKSVALM